MKCIICILLQLNILCLICINRQYPKIALNLPMTQQFCSICIRNTVKQGRSITHVVSPDEIQHIKSKSEWGVCRTTAEGNKTFPAKCYGFCRCLKLAETNLVFVQSDAKITVRTYSNKVYCRQFAVSRTTSWFSRTERLHTVHTTLSLKPIPAFQCARVHWTRKLAAEQSESKSRGLFSVGSVAADGVSSQNFRHWSAEASSDRLLGWAKPRHTEPSDWSAAKETDDGCQGKGWSCWISSELTIGVRHCPCFTVFRIKIEHRNFFRQN